MTSHTAIPQLIGFVLEDQTELTLADLCRACATQANVVIELVDEGLIVPSGPTPNTGVSPACTCNARLSRCACRKTWG